MNRTPERIRDEWLVLRAQDGDRDAITELIARWQPKLLAHATRLTGRHDAAADVVQESWMAMVKGLRRLDDPACFPRWAYQIVTRRSTDWIREQARRRKLSEVASVTAPTQTEASAGNDDVEALRHAIRQLPPEQRTLLVMHYLDGLSIAEIAEALSIPPGTVKSRLYAIRGQLKGLLEEKSDAFTPVPLSSRERGKG